MVVRESNGYRKVREDTGGSGRVIEGPGRSWRIWEGPVSSWRVCEGPVESWSVGECLKGSERVQKVFGGSGDFLVFILRLNIQVCYVVKKNIMSSFHFVKLTSWTEATLDKCLHGKKVSLDNRPSNNCCNTIKGPNR